MVRKHQEFTAAAVRTRSKPGRYLDSRNLYLYVRSADQKFWVFRFTSPVTGKLRDMGLGPAAGRGAVTLREARDLADAARHVLREGRDPLEERQAARARAKADRQHSNARRKTFKDAAEAYITAHNSEWSNAKHRYQWSSTLETYAYPHFGDVPVSDITTAHVLAALKPIWETKTETAKRLRARVAKVLDFARASKWRHGDNPADWRGNLEPLLAKPSQIRSVAHHPALPWKEVGSFMAGLRQRDATTARALEFAILTAARTGEVVGAKWDEFDFAAKTWRVPASRMKAKRDHVVPLSETALEILRRQSKRQEAGSRFVFTGDRGDRPISNMALLKLLHRLKRKDLTVHGFRSTFRDWAAEHTNYQNHVAEMALAHKIGDKVEAAYRRGELLAKRRNLMDDWARFCAAPSHVGDGTVTPIRGRITS